MPDTGFTLEGIVFPVAPDALIGFSIREIVFPLMGTPVFTGLLSNAWVAQAGGRWWVAQPGGRYWSAEN